MHLSIHTLRAARDVLPGDRIAMDPRKGVDQPDLVVDEVRHLGLDGTMDIYGRAPGVTTGQRRKLTAHAATGLRAMPTAEQAHQVWALLMAAADAAEGYPTEGDALAHLDPDADRPSRTVWLGNGDAEVMVLLDRAVWTVVPELPPLPTDGG